MNIAIIGSGISGSSIAKYLLKKNNDKVYMFDYDCRLNHDEEDKVNFPKEKISPKFYDHLVTKSIKSFKEKYNIITNNFFLTSSLIQGGSSNFWGGGLEIPDKQYLANYFDKNKILNEVEDSLDEIGIQKDKFEFFESYFNSSKASKLLENQSEDIYIDKLLLAVNQKNNQENTKICNFKNTCFIHCKNNSIYNSSNLIEKLKKNKNFIFFSNKFIENVVSLNNKNFLLYNEKSFVKKFELPFDKVIISAGTIGSTILVDKILQRRSSYKIYHTPIIQLAYFNFNILKKINFSFSLPLLKINIKNKINYIKGSLIHGECIGNIKLKNFFENFLFFFLKNFFLLGNLFLPYDYSNTEMKVGVDKVLIKSKKRSYTEKKFIFNLNKKLNTFFRKLYYLPIPSKNFQLFKEGSDAHYTSTLYNSNFFSKNHELKDKNNIHVIDGSVIAPGLTYPTFFLMIYSNYLAKEIFNNDKKDKN